MDAITYSKDMYLGKFWEIVRDRETWYAAIQFSSVQFSSSVVSDSAIPWTAVCQASMSITISWSLLKLMSIESVMPCNHLILCHPLFLLPSIFPSIRVFQMSQFFASGGQSFRVSASASIGLQRVRHDLVPDQQQYLGHSDSWELLYPR